MGKHTCTPAFWLKLEDLQTEASLSYKRKQSPENKNKERVKNKIVPEDMNKIHIEKCLHPISPSTDAAIQSEQIKPN